jgi:acyl phosphate:glycerol-3-phosphate acyltransferase
MNITSFIISALIGYALGCLQSAYIIGKLAGRIDIREHGSNNAGASNVTTILGWKYGIMTALLDIVKAVVAVLIVKNMYPASPDLEFAAGAFAILGHIFPFYLKFRGGKGAASLIGMFLAIDIKIAIILALSIVILTLVLDYIAIGSIAMFTAAPISSYFLGYPLGAIVICAGLAIICYYKHYINIVRILKGEEVGLRKVINKNNSKTV